MADDFGFFITVMPESRPANYHLGCLEVSVFIDFDNYTNELIRLTRISFDGYGCYILTDKAIPMNETDSHIFKKNMETNLSEQNELTTIIKKTLFNNREFISEDALIEYGL